MGSCCCFSINILPKKLEKDKPSGMQIDAVDPSTPIKARAATEELHREDEEGA